MNFGVFGVLVFKSKRWRVIHTLSKIEKQLSILSIMAMARETSPSVNQ
jgi:hypothetical protein